MSINIGNRILYESRNGEYLTGEIVNIWKNNGKDITDFIACLDPGLYILLKPNYPNWCLLDYCYLFLENSQLPISFQSPGSALVVNM
jgi:hypothetical protein